MDNYEFYEVIYAELGTLSDILENELDLNNKRDLLQQLVRELEYALLLES